MKHLCQHGDDPAMTGDDLLLWLVALIAGLLLGKELRRLGGAFVDGFREEQDRLKRHPRETQR